jgi:hypothetical protein
MTREGAPSEDASPDAVASLQADRSEVGLRQLAHREHTRSAGTNDDHIRPIG